MATREEWWEYFNELQERIKKIQNSDLPSDIKEKVTDELLDKLNIVKKYFLEYLTRAPPGAHKSIRIWRQQYKGPALNK